MATSSAVGMPWSAVPITARDRSAGDPLDVLVDPLGQLDRDVPVVANCAGGYRSLIAASLLRHVGLFGVSDRNSQASPATGRARARTSWSHPAGQRQSR